MVKALLLELSEGSGIKRLHKYQSSEEAAKALVDLQKRLVMKQIDSGEYIGTYSWKQEEMFGFNFSAYPGSDGDSYIVIPLE